MCDNYPEAFFDLCPDAQPAEGQYISLYVSDQYYGGPEEGGWWGHDVSLVAYRWCESKIEAERRVEAVRAEVERLNQSAQDEFGDHCNRQLEWLEARGLEADYLPEGDGPWTYFVTSEDHAGAASSGDRSYS